MNLKHPVARQVRRHTAPAVLDLAGQIGAQHRLLLTRAIKSRPRLDQRPSENTPAFIDRSCDGYHGQVSMPAIPTMRWRMSSSSNVPVARQLNARGDRSRTA